VAEVAEVAESGEWSGVAIEKVRPAAPAGITQIAPNIPRAHHWTAPQMTPAQPLAQSLSSAATLRDPRRALLGFAQAPIQRAAAARAFPPFRGLDRPRRPRLRATMKQSFLHHWKTNTTNAWESQELS